MQVNSELQISLIPPSSVFLLLLRNENIRDPLLPEPHKQIGEHQNSNAKERVKQILPVKMFSTTENTRFCPNYPSFPATAYSNPKAARPTEHEAHEWHTPWL